MQNKTGRPFAAGFFFIIIISIRRNATNFQSTWLVRSFVGVHGAIDRGNVDEGTQ